MNIDHVWTCGFDPDIWIISEHEKDLLSLLVIIIFVEVLLLWLLAFCRFLYVNIIILFLGVKQATSNPLNYWKIPECLFCVSRI